MIQFSNVNKTYENGKHALKHVSFHLEKGELAFLTGHSGAGKSTLLKLIMAVEEPTRGQIVVNSRNISRLTRWQTPKLRRNIGMIYQNPMLLMSRNVFDNVALPLVIHGYRHSEMGKKVRTALDMVGLLSKEKQLPISLSGGEQQRVGIARAIVNRPPLILADEPTGNLDPNLSEEIMRTRLTPA